MYHRGRRLFRHLRNRYRSLPSAATLRNFAKKAALRPGKNPAVIRALTKTTDRMPDLQKDVVAMFDEVSLKKCHTYLKHLDRVVGSADYCDGPLEKVAGHGLIFMVKSLFGDWKAAYLYHLTSGKEDGATIADLIVRSITSVQETGLRVRVLVCDGPLKHITALRLLGATPEKPFIFINGQKVFVLIDPPHLMKSVRNNLQSHIFHLPGRPDIKFEYIKTFAQKDARLPVQVAPKLTKIHLQTSSQAKQKVGIAYETLSASVAAGLYTHVAYSQLPQEAQETADFVKDMDALADSFNGKAVAATPQPDEPPLLKPFKVALTDESPHIRLWARMKTMFSQLTFTRVKSKAKVHSLPFQKSWVMSMNAAEQLFGDLKEENREFLPMQSLNQDFLENFNASIRRSGGDRRNPTSYEFESSFASSLINALTAPSTKTNCLADGQDLLVELRSLFPEEPLEQGADESIRENEETPADISPNSSISLSGSQNSEGSMSTDGLKVFALTLLQKLRGLTEFCVLCEAASLSRCFDQCLQDPGRIGYPPDLELFLSKLESLHLTGRRLCPEIFQKDKTKALYKAGLSKVDLSELVFCSEHEGRAYNFILEEVTNESFSRELKRLNQQIRAKDTLSVMVEERGRDAGQRYEELVADLFRDLDE